MVRPAACVTSRTSSAARASARTPTALIEQGKVDSLLRASPKDRRAIFEEAAGISRFKAKKVEAQRRLERVEQNLLRLSDIVDEVGTRLKRVRSQASKAQRYKEYTDRLQALRTQVGRVDWQRYTENLALVESEISVLTDQMGSHAAELEALEAKALASETEMSVAEEDLRSCEARASRARERKAACESIIAQQKSITIELEEETARNRQRLAAMNMRAGDLSSQVREVNQSLRKPRQRQPKSGKRSSNTCNSARRFPLAYIRRVAKPKPSERNLFRKCETPPIWEIALPRTSRSWKHHRPRSSARKKRWQKSAPN